MQILFDEKKKKSALRIEQGLQLVAHKIGSKFKQTLCPNSYTDVRNLTCKCVLQSRETMIHNILQCIKKKRL